ncbi:MAG TPA: class I SAM-dependent methyltransferase [Chthoniobacterales bacterium]|nr:class I SAM-dependent methyltransferase [Chthoniobacterales bacterium]
MINRFEWLDPALLRQFEREGTNAHRLCTTDRGWVERFGRDILISFQNQTEREKSVSDFLAWTKTVQFGFDRIFGRLLPKQSVERAAPRLLSGDSSASPRTTVTERRLKFGIDFAAGYSVGLFIDQRENRAVVRELAPRRLLNCFAFTCSFSVAAASAGTQTVNVDLSKKWLARGRENFRLNGLSTNGHRFIEDDVRPFLRRLARRSEKFDVIILDPPTFSRAPGGKAFRVEHDFADLLLGALELTIGGAQILLSTNCATLDTRSLETVARFCLRQTGRVGTFRYSKQPIDLPPGGGASSGWLTLR